MSDSVYEKSTREIDHIHQPFIVFARSRGWLVEKVISLSRRGWPDIFLARKGRIVLCEFKRPGEEPTAQQAKRHRELRAAGVEVVWFDNLDKAKEFFK